MLLARRLHHQKITIGQIKGMALGAMPLPQLKISCRPQRQRSDRLGRINLRFIVGMPAHAVMAVAIAIKQTTVETGAAVVIHRLQERQKPFGPSLTVMDHTAIAV